MSFAISDYISGTMTGEALKYLVTVALKPSHGSRLGQNNVRTVALVITDGKSQDYHRGTLSKWQRKAKVNIFFAFFNAFSILNSKGRTIDFFFGLHLDTLKKICVVSWVRQFL